MVNLASSPAVNTDDFLSATVIFSSNACHDFLDTHFFSSKYICDVFALHFAGRKFSLLQEFSMKIANLLRKESRNSSQGITDGNTIAFF